MSILKILAFICNLLLDTLYLSYCEQTDEFFVRLNGAYSWQPEMMSYRVRHRSLCLSGCLITKGCVAAFTRYEDGVENNLSCTLLGKLLIGSIQRLESGETWINRTESARCPDEFRFTVGDNCYYLETAAVLSWNNSKSKCQTLHWYSDLAELETMSEYNDLKTELSNITINGWVWIA